MATATHEDKREGSSRQTRKFDGPGLAGIASLSDALYHTQYGTWYPLFKKHAPKSSILNISLIQPEFIDWMQKETIVLPTGSGPSTMPSNLTSRSSSGSDVSAYADDEDADSDSTREVRLDALDAEIRRILLKYDRGPVFPKLNWSAPLDASFMLAGNNLQCQHPEDIYLLLKSSEFAAADLEQIQEMSSIAPAANSTRPDTLQEGDVTLPIERGSASSYPWHLQLVLKQWFAFNKSYEFRCFVRAGHLLAVSQRDVTFYSHLQDKALHEEIKDKIWDFWLSVLSECHQFPLQDYIFDAYLSKDRSRVWLIDINPWLPRTDPLLFTFEHLELLHEEARARPLPTQEDLCEDFERIQLAPHQTTTGCIEQCPWDADDVELRVLTDERMQTTSATYSANMVPRDLVDFATGASRIANGEPGKSTMSVDQVVDQWNRHVMGQDAVDSAED